jgi:hypothetical protein
MSSAIMTPNHRLLRRGCIRGAARHHPRQIATGSLRRIARISRAVRHPWAATVFGSERLLMTCPRHEREAQNTGSEDANDPPPVRGAAGLSSR